MLKICFSFLHVGFHFLRVVSTFVNVFSEKNRGAVHFFCQCLNCDVRKLQLASFVLGVHRKQVVGTNPAHTVTLVAPLATSLS